MSAKIDDRLEAYHQIGDAIGKINISLFDFRNRDIDYSTLKLVIKGELEKCLNILGDKRRVRMEEKLKGRIIAVDFDGTIAHYDSWEGEGVFGAPIQGVQWALGQFKKMGAIIVVNTCRKETALIIDYLDGHKIPCDFVNYSPKNKELDLSPSKIAADIYIDDKGVSFRGEWQETYKQVVNFRRWGKDLGGITSKG